MNTDSETSVGYSSLIRVFCVIRVRSFLSPKRLRKSVNSPSGLVKGESQGIAKQLPCELRTQHLRADRHRLDAFHVRLKPDARAVEDVNATLGVDLNFRIDNVPMKITPASGDITR